MPEWVEAIGAFVRWLWKGRKTSLRDEVGGNFKNTWGPSYDTENLLIGYAVSALVLTLVILIFLK